MVLDYTQKYPDEAATIDHLLESLNWTDPLSNAAQNRAISLIEKCRTQKRKLGSLEQFLQQYPLNSEEGLALMILAEAFLRIPDNATRNALIKDRLLAADWNKKASHDWLSKLTGLGLGMSKRTLTGFFGALSQPLIRQSMASAMKVMGEEFVLGQTIEDALRKAAKSETLQYSFDMLGEGARTKEDAQKYFDNYANAIEQIGATKLKNPAGISVKLSALHPRYEYAQKDICVPELCDSLRHLCALAAKYDIALTIDAEEADRLDISLDIFDRVLRGVPKDWQKFGLALQAYQKRSYAVLDHIITLAEQSGQRIPVRLVKGAYWDTEIKHAQVLGLSDYTVFTRKCHTDLSYLTCAEKMLRSRSQIYPMFGTHNAHTIATLLEMAGADRGGFEFQRLHGMGEGLYNVVREQIDTPVSLYAPVGPHSDLLPYLVRRLLENGANSSFVNKLYDPDTPASELVSDPIIKTKSSPTKRHPSIPLPLDIYADRTNSTGLDLTYETAIQPCLKKITLLHDNLNLTEIPYSNSANIDRAFQKAQNEFRNWAQTPAKDRANILEKIADLYEDHKDELMALLIKEGFKTIPDARDEIREAVDFCRYYAQQGRKVFSEEGITLPGPTGEKNILLHEARGTFVCIAPWNFPLAIFTGQIVAALMSGNAVIAKPAEQTPHIGKRAVELMHAAGIPRDILHLIIGDGKVGAELVAHKQAAGVAFTGSLAAAKKINHTLALKDGPIVPFIAETGGQNAMIVDSSALLEQVIDDTIHSAFGSTGQRCSALRILFLQNEIADHGVKMLQGAMAELHVGNPLNLSTDIGPVIDGDAHNMLVQHQKYLEGAGRKIANVQLDHNLSKDQFYFAPCAFEIDSMDLLKEEIFGPILHVIRYDAKDLDQIIQQINESGFGLTFGMHSRIETQWKKVSTSMDTGNAYINRGMTGAIVGSQPFGGRGLSGTGPKAGGPHYLHAFATEKVISIDTTASGGNASLVSLED